MKLKTLGSMRFKDHTHHGKRRKIEEASGVTGATIWKHATTLLKLLGEAE